MRKNLFYAALAMTLGLASCSSSDDITADNNAAATTDNTITLKPAQSAKVALLSNGQEVENDAVVTAKYETVTYKTWEDNQLMLENFPEGGNNIPNFTKDFLYYAKDGDVTLTMTRIYQQTNQTHYLGIYYYDTKGNKVEQIITDQDMEQFTDGDWNTNKQAKRITVKVKQGYYFGFFINGRNNGETTGNLVSDNPSYPEKWYTESKWNNERKYWNNENTEKVHAGTKVLKGNTYLMFEDWTDFDCNDFAFRIEGTVETVEHPDDPTPTPTPTPTPDPDTKKDSTTVDPTPEPEPEPTPDPTDPVVTENGGSIEANLDINDPHEKGDWTESHLSIHVRDTSDVTVFIPVPAEYYAAKDDMFIVEKHIEGAYAYNTEYTETVSMDINGNTVSLNITYAENGITVATQGVNADVLKYLREKYNDGLTFEVRNYFSTPENASLISREDLKKYLDKATITFTNAPKTYVNAKGLVDGAEHTYASTVTPTDVENRTVPEAAVKSEHEQANLYIYPLKETSAVK